MQEEKKTPRAFLVLGPESSGTRIMAKLLTRCGVVGSFEHDQPLIDKNQIKSITDDILLRYSVPHLKVWPDISYVVNYLRIFGFEVIGIVMTRAWWPMMESQAKAGHVRHQTDALSNIAGAYHFIMRHLAAMNVTYIMVSYEELGRNYGQYVPRTCAMLRLPNPDPFPAISEENAKHYETK